MNELPSEILVNIFSSLHFNQKLECMSVCRQWANVIRSESLLRTVCFHKQEVLDSFISMLESQPSQRAKVKHLATFSQRKLCLYVNQFCHLTPNLKSIYINWICTPLKKDEDEIEDLSIWRNNLEVLKEPLRHSLTLHLLNSGKWTKLTTLVVNCAFSGTRIFRKLANTPCLLELTLITCHASFHTLEKLHSDLQFLKVFTLRDVNLSLDRVLMNSIPIHPATSVTTFSVSFLFGGQETPVKLLKYIRKKYTSLTNLQIDHDWKEDISRSRDLQIIRDGLFPVIKSLSHQLKVLEIRNATIKQDFFNSLASSGLFNMELKIASRFDQFKRFNFISNESWKFLRELTVEMMFNSQLHSLTHLRLLVVLRLRYKRLMMDYGGIEEPSFDLNSLFGLCPPSLQMLQVIGFQITCDLPCKSIPNIKELQISSRNILQGAYQFINNNLPKLRSLTLKYEYPTGDTILLENLNLSFLSIEIKISGYAKVKIPNVNRCLYYPMISQMEHVPLFEDTRSISEYGRIKSMQKESLSDPCVVDLTCNSIDTLVLNRHVAF